jgi:hypothetical protein
LKLERERAQHKAQLGLASFALVGIVQMLSERACCSARRPLHGYDHVMMDVDQLFTFLADAQGCSRLD